MWVICTQHNLSEFCAQDSNKSAFLNMKTSHDCNLLITNLIKKKTVEEDEKESKYESLEKKKKKRKKKQTNKKTVRLQRYNQSSV